MPAYAQSRLPALFFIVYLYLVLYCIMNLMLATVCASFCEQEKTMTRLLLLHRRKAAQQAYRLLLGHSCSSGFTLTNFQGLMRYADPSKSINLTNLSFDELISEILTSI